MFRRKPAALRSILLFFLDISVIIAAVIMAGGIFYWLGLPETARQIAGGVSFILILTLWFWPSRKKLWRRLGAILIFAAFFSVYYTKSPVEQDWVVLHERRASASFEGDIVTIHNFRDARHQTGVDPDVNWMDQSFDLSTVETAELIVQPFGDSPFLVHIFMTFGFENGEHLAVSVEARRTSWETFQPIGGFFRFFETYPVFGTERDLIGKRLANDPPEEMYFYDLELSPSEVRSILEDLLNFTNELTAEPDFYDTLEESCFTGLVNQSGALKSRIPSWDVRRWIPGYALPLMRDHGLISDERPIEELEAAAHLRSDISHPFSFETDRDFSIYLRTQIGQD
ncbi:DUF4105 domain-containing protein [Ponticaulis sp.]|uniref:lipoprotein N-acyltransferase Lnb domain-containing protein n=1 Tax=Ponticaulis sp. TaxID=2020902 RepID=UPI000B6FF073|nr:DUF4105 domain-containing protein [Ponticaulis sp.]MAI90344.1 hypothetical protein [Ponticaulis sp.]OUX99980.1 MAG: hypothetical protein CBB65_07885 [Hyphomonadaceae bacterium TMED5]|tara:strand:- start:316586 stop:317608 length:1023 start_codon:yes stop_codon:yes gene_type:complete